MKMFRIDGGVAHIGAGETVLLSADQFKARTHTVEMVGKPGEDGAVVVTAKTVLDFKAGETIGLPGDPPKPFSHRFIDLSAPPPLPKEAVSAITGKPVAAQRGRARR